MNLFVILTTLSFSLSVFAQETNIVPKEGGNGQLVVIPVGHKKPVPYEVAVAWETGKYRNFFKLPCMPGVVEPRKEFNKNYACSALPWLELVKELSPVLHQGLMDVAAKTHFNIINNYILWEHKPYPDGEIDYKKYEKAAFFNGEIIFSTRVMDQVGSLSTVLTSEQNQGYIVLHELINALYPNQDVKWKLDLGEIFIQKLMFNHSKAEALVNLGLINLDYILGEKDLELLKDVLREIQSVRPDSYNYVDKYIFMIENYLETGLSFKDAYSAYLNKQAPKGFVQFMHAHDTFMNAVHYTPGGRPDTGIFNTTFVKELSDMFEVPLHMMGRINGVKPATFRRIADTKQKEIIMSGVKNYIAKLEGLSTSKFFEEAHDLLQRQFQESGENFESKMLNIVNQNVSFDELTKWELYGLNIWSSRRTYDFVRKNLAELKSILYSSLASQLEKRGFDFARTTAYLKWRLVDQHCDDSWNITVAPPFEEGTHILMNSAVYAVTSISKNRKGVVTVVMNGPKKIKTHIIIDFKPALIFKSKESK